MAENKESTPTEDEVAQEAFKRVRERIQPSLEMVINTVAVNLWAKRVIHRETFEKIFNVAHQGAAWRSMYFMSQFCKKVEDLEKDEPSHEKAKQMIAGFVAILREAGALDYVADIVAGCDGSSDLIDATHDIATSLDGSLIQIAPSMYARSWITEMEYNVIVDPSAEHATAATNAVLSAVSRAIKVNSKNLGEFKNVLAGMGKPISELALLITKTESEIKEERQRKEEERRRKEKKDQGPKAVGRLNEAET